MTIWIIEPRDPLIVRDGRPFGPDPGARATSLPFPFPSTTTGGVRTRAGLDKGIFDIVNEKDKQEQLKSLKQLAVRGPLLVQLTHDGNDIDADNWLVPAPRDALLFPPKLAPLGTRIALIQQLVPLQLPEGGQTDFRHEGLLLVGQPGSHYDQRKPLEDAPRFWFWKTFLDWLLNPATYNRKEIGLYQIGLHGPFSEQRMHVSIDADKEVARDGMLFQTSGLEFTSPGEDEHRLKDARRLALAVAVDEHQQFQLSPGCTSFGGERRIITWRKSHKGLPCCSPELEQAIITNKACRVFLLTPACFEQGYLPTQFRKDAEQHGITASLKAIAIQRPQVASGWDLDLRKPKSSRRLAPAGTVFFLALEGNDDAIRTWIRSTWMRCISDDPQDCMDGFGLAVLGTWSGRPESMEKEHES
jgi:CRISPR-associated protein Cmr3